MVAVVALCALVFLGLAGLVALGATRAADLAVTVAFQSVASYPLDAIANAHTIVGHLLVTLPLAGALALFAWRRLGGWAWLGPTAILATGAVELLFKVALVHPSPPTEFVRAFGDTLAIRVGSSSFPSGHVARITFLAIVAASFYPRSWTWLAASLAIAASVFLRVYIGDHWISDALAAVALGMGAAVVAIWWMRTTGRR